MKMSDRIAQLSGWSSERDPARAWTVLQHLCGAWLVIADEFEEQSPLPPLAADAALAAVREADLTGAEGVRLDLQIVRTPIGYTAELVGTPGATWNARC